MTDFSTQREQFHWLLDCLLDLEMDVDQQVRLNELLREYPEARSEYRKYLTFHANLSWDGRIEAGVRRALQELCRPASVEVQPKAAVVEAPLARSIVAPCRLIWDMFRAACRPILWPATWSVLGFGVAFTAYVVLISWGILDRNVERRRLEASAENRESFPLLPPVSGPQPAVVTASDGVIWSGASAELSTLALGQPVATGDAHEIASGVIELKLDQGTTLLIEGPAEWSIDGQNGATLYRGTLVACVPEKAVGFALATPTGRIVDLGTRFGVEVGEDGATNVRVLAGAVELSESGESSALPAQRLEAGQAARISAPGMRDAVPPAAADKIERLADRQLPSTVRRPSDAESYAASVRALKPLVYLPIRRADGMTFGSDEGRRFIARFSRTEGPGEAWEESPFGDALRFRGEQHIDRVTLDPAEPTDATGAADPPLSFSRGPDLPGHPFSVVLWTRSQTNRETGTLIGKGAGFREQYLLDVLEGKMRFVTISADREVVTNVYSTSLICGSWQHVAGVFDPENQVSRIYVNGILEGTMPLEATTLFATDETTYIGNRPFPEGNKPLTLDGAVDEIAIFDRALEDYEISALYRLLLTTPSTNSSTQAPKQP